MKTLYVTYGWGSQQRNNFSKVEGEDLTDCWQQIEHVTGRKYAFVYLPKDFEGQPEKYGLTEIPLQPQRGGRMKEGVAKIEIEGPGSSGVVWIDVTEDQLVFLQDFAELFNHSNPLHAQPFVTVTKEEA